MVEIEFITDVLAVTVVPIVGSFIVGFFLAMLIERKKKIHTGKITNKSLIAELHSLMKILDRIRSAVEFSTETTFKWSYKGISTPVLDKVIFSEWFLELREDIRQKISDVQMHNKTINEMYNGLFQIIYFSNHSDTAKRIKDFTIMIDEMKKAYQKDVSELIKKLES